MCTCLRKVLILETLKMSTIQESKGSVSHSQILKSLEPMHAMYTFLLSMSTLDVCQLESLIYEYL